MFALFKRNVIPQCSGIEIHSSPIHGLGVFAKKIFKYGNTIEIAPLILLPEKEKQLLKSTELFNYYFLVEGHQNIVALGLGYSSMYNHAGIANAVYTISFSQRKLIIKACKTIYPEEEITVNYHGAPNDKSPVYFEHNTISQ